MRKSSNAKLLIAATASMLAACGGGGGGGGGSGVGSTPPPPPPPPPPTQTGPILAPGVATTTDFSVVGYERGTGDTTVADLATSGFSVRYDAGGQSYLIGLPSFGSGAPGAFSRTVDGPDYYTGTIPDSTGTAYVAARRPSSGPYQYSTTVKVDVGVDTTYSVMAFGLATPTGAVPMTGTASYVAHLDGAVIGHNYTVWGTANFNFDFGAGTLSGSMNPVLIDAWEATPIGPYSFNNTVYSSGSTAFSGAMAHANGSTGAFSGLFTGPAAQEMIGRYDLRFLDQYSNTTETLFGAFVGRKQ